MNISFKHLLCLSYIAILAMFFIHPANAQMNWKGIARIISGPGKSNTYNIKLDNNLCVLNKDFLDGDDICFHKSGSTEKYRWNVYKDSKYEKLIYLHTLYNQEIEIRISNE